MFGPVFWSELTRTARRRRHLVVRALYCCLLLAVLWISYLSIFHAPAARNALANSAMRGPVTIGQMADFARHFVISYGVLQLSVALLVTLSVTAGTIAEERDRRTIEYLFVTHLSDGEIVLDKLAVRLLHVMSLLLAALPILAVSMLFGGVGMAPLVELSMVTLGTIIGTASLCLYVSVTTRRGRDAFLRSLLILVAGLTVPGIVSQALFRSAVTVPWWVHEGLNQLREMNPFIYFMKSSLRSVGGASVNWEVLSLFARNVSLMSVYFLGLAIWQVRRAHLKTASRAGVRSRRPLRLLRPPQIGNHPVLWKELFAERFIQREHRWSTWVAPAGLAFIALAIVVYYWLCRERFRDLRPRDFLHAAMVIEGTIGCVFILLAGARGAVSISHEREQSTWDTLLTTTVEAREIVLSKIAGSLFVLRGLIGVYLVVWWFEHLLRPHESWRGGGMLATTLLLGLFMASLGVLLSQYMRSTTWSITLLVGMAVFLGGGYLIVAAPLAEFFFPSGRAQYVLAVSLVFLDTFWNWYEPHRTNLSFDSLVAYLMGLVFYGLATVALIVLAIKSFERVVRKSGPVRFVIPPRDQAAPAVPPKLASVLDIRTP